MANFHNEGSGKCGKMVNKALFSKGCKLGLFLWLKECCNHFALHCKMPLELTSLTKLMNRRLAGFKVSAFEYENPTKSGNGFCPKPDEIRNDAKRTI